MGALFKHFYPTANESLENVQKLTFLKPTGTNIFQAMNKIFFTTPLNYIKDI
jgi:hypothetical protein